MDKKKIIVISIAALVVGFLIGLLVYVIKGHKKEVQEVVVEKPVYYEDLTKINKLECEIESQKKEIAALKNRVQEVKEVVIIEKEKIKKLDPDSGVIVLRQNLDEYAEVKCDSFPALMEDSLVVINNDNLININSVFIDYRGAKDIIRNQDEIIYRDSIVVNHLDSINTINIGIRDNLEKAWKKERTKRYVWMGVGIGTTITAIVVGIIGGLKK